MRLTELVGRLDGQLTSLTADQDELAETWHGRAASAAALRVVKVKSSASTVSGAVESLSGDYDSTAGVAEAAQAYLVSVVNGARLTGFDVADNGLVTATAKLSALAGVAGPTAETARLEIEAEAQRLTLAVADALRQADEAGRTIADRLRRGLQAIYDAGNAVDAHSIPGPPPQPTPDPGAGEHGSDPWYTTLDDEAKKTWIGHLATLADGKGMTHAAGMLHHYLDNSGNPAFLNPDEMSRDLPEFRAATDATAQAEMQRIAGEAASTGNYGQPVPFSTGWNAYSLDPQGDRDWYLATGSGHYAVTGVATVHPPDTPGLPPRIEVDYQTHVVDKYNWDGTKSTEIAGRTVTDAELAELHRAGVAQEFTMQGSSQPRHFDGVVPPPRQQLHLPPAPDSRDGTRSDPTR